MGPSPCLCVPPQGDVRRVHDPLTKLRLQPGQPRPVRVQQPITGHALGGATEGTGAGAAVRRVPGGPGSHAIPSTLLQVSRLGSTGVAKRAPVAHVVFVTSATSRDFTFPMVGMCCPLKCDK